MLAGSQWVDPPGSPGGADPYASFPFTLVDNPTGPKTATGSNIGNVTYAVNGAVIDGVNANVITVNANNVTIRNFEAIRVSLNNANTNLILEDGVIDNGVNTGNGTQFQNVSCYRVEITGGEDGMKGGENTVVEDCWIHDLYWVEGRHNDGIQCSGGEGITITGTRFEGIRGTAAIFGKPDFGDVGGILIDNCYFDLCGNHCIRMDNAGADAPFDVTVTNCMFGETPQWLIDLFGPGEYYRDFDALCTDITWSGNVRESDLTTVTYP